MNNTKMKIITPLKDLNLSNRFLFDEVTEDEQTHRDMLEIIFGKEIPLLTKNETEKELRVSVSRHEGQKCERCWNYFDELLEADGNRICSRCKKVIEA